MSFVQRLCVHCWQAKARGWAAVTCRDACTVQMSMMGFLHQCNATCDGAVPDALVALTAVFAVGLSGCAEASPLFFTGPPAWISFTNCATALKISCSIQQMSLEVSKLVYS